jgi:putative spermidine/putrescine transport system permease protein
MLAFGYAVLYSFGLIGIANKGFTTDFWVKVLKEGEFWNSFLYSSLIATVTMVISIGLALLMVVKHHSDFKKKYISFIGYLPLAIPGIVAAFFSVQVLSKSGFFSRISYNIGLINDLTQFPDLINDFYAIGIISTFISVVTPFFILLFLSVYQNERIDDLTTLAQSLGSNPSQSTWKVTIPILLQKARRLIALYFIFLLGAYEVPLILGRESPQMLSVLIVRDLRQYDLSQISEGYVVAVIYTLIVGLITFLIFSQRKERYA